MHAFLKQISPNAKAVAILALFIAAMSYNGGENVLQLFIASILATLITATILIRHNHLHRFTLPNRFSATTLYTLFVIWAVTSLLWSVEIQATVIGSIQNILALFVIIIGLHLGLRDKILLLKLFIILAVLLSLYSTTLSFLFSAGRVPAIMENLNSYAILLVSAFLLLVFSSIDSTHPRTNTHLAAALIIALGIAATRSSGATLMLVAALLVMLIYFRQQRQALIRLGLFIAAAIAGYLLFEGIRQILPGNEQWLTMVDKLESTGSLNARFLIWDATWEIVKNYPFTGSGHATFHKVFPAFRLGADASGGYNAHNDYLQTWSQLGPVGFLLITAFALAATLPGLKQLVAGHNHTNRHTFPAYTILAIILLPTHITANLQQLPLLVLIGLLVGHIDGRQGNEAPQSQSPLWSGGIIKGMIALLALTFMIPHILFIASYQLTEMAKKSLESQYIDLTTNQASALANYFLRPYLIRSSLFIDMLGTTGNKQKREKIFNAGMATLDEASRYSSREYLIPYQRARLLAAMNKEENTIAAAFDKSLQLDPQQIKTRLDYFSFLIKSKNYGYEQACAMLEQGINRRVYNQSDEIYRFIDHLINCRESFDHDGIEAMLAARDELLATSRARLVKLGFTVRDDRHSPELTK
ncbi:MAG: O-antigen ligase family protein [Gammaproteobacteria bacterium]|nr:O-antigen ligase family protein [Gammaproteobacteria bacterium]